MSLIDIKKYMMNVKTASLGSLCTVFNAKPEMVRCLLSHLMRKGCIRQCSKQPACGTQCFKCPVQVTEIYEWI